MTFEYTGIRVRDLERSSRFYCDGLGMVRGPAGRMSAGGQWLELDDPDSGGKLELNYYPDNPPFREGDELDHLAFRVTDLPGTITRLEGLGGRLRIPAFIEGPTRLAFLSDPDGAWIELEELLDSDEPPSSKPVS